MAARTSPDNDLVEVAADFAILGGEFPDSGKQLVIDRRHMDNGAYGRPPYRLPEKFRLADTIGRKPRCEVGVFFICEPCLDDMAAVGRVVSLRHRLKTSSHLFLLLNFFGFWAEKFSPHSSYWATFLHFGRRNLSTPPIAELFGK